MANMLPQEFIDRMKKELGNEAEAFLGSYFASPKKGLRINPLKVSAETESNLTEGMSQIPWEGRGYYYADSDIYADDEDALLSKYVWRMMPGKSPLHAAGAYYIQEPSAMAPVAFLDVKPGMCVLDLCAAPGGKSTQIAAYMKNNGLLVSNEIVADRARILSQNIERLGICNSLVLNHDPRELAERFPAVFDRILVDAPCSGEGMFRKDQTAIDEWSRDNVIMCAKRQSWILDAAATMLKPGGRLVYSTCTFSKEEDEGQIESFLLRHQDYHAVDVIPMAGMRQGDACGTLRIMPHDGYGEGHFIAVLERDGETSEAEYGYMGLNEKVLSNKERQKISPYLNFLTQYAAGERIKNELFDQDKLFFFANNLCLLPEGGMPMLSGLKAPRAGLRLGEIRNDRFVPSHSLAMALKPDDVASHVDFDINDARVKQYINGQTITIENQPKTCDGWKIVAVSSVSLGWAKSSNGVLKNHYPKGLRLYQ